MKNDPKAHASGRTLLNQLTFAKLAADHCMKRIKPSGKIHRNNESVGAMLDNSHPLKITNIAQEISSWQYKYGTYDRTIPILA